MDTVLPSIHYTPYNASVTIHTCTSTSRYTTERERERGGGGVLVFIHAESEQFEEKEDEEKTNFFLHLGPLLIPTTLHAKYLTSNFLPSTRPNL